MNQALSHLKILDLSRLLTGPFCTMLLADMGAEVIKIETPGVGDDTRQWSPKLGTESTYYLSVNRNKRSMTLNLKSPEGKEILRRLVQNADVVIENFRPGTMERLGLGYDTLSELNPGLIYCCVSGFGLTGPYRDKPGYDLLAQAMGGLMGITGEPGRPPVKAGMSVADIGSGMYATIGILMALQARSVTGRGQLVETSLLETVVSWQTYLAGSYWATGHAPAQTGSGHPSIAPYQALRARDQYLIVAVGNESLWQKFCAALGLPELAEAELFRSNRDRVQHREQLVRHLEEILSAATAAEWIARFDEAGVPAGPIYTLDQVWSDPQVLAREMVMEMEHPEIGTIRVPGFPIKFSQTPGALRTAPPTLGQHTDEILGRLGYSEADMERLKAAGVV